jgi:hypothetical protein
VEPRGFLAAVWERGAARLLPSGGTVEGVSAGGMDSFIGTTIWEHRAAWLLRSEDTQ